MCIDFISNQHQHEQALCTLHLFRKNPTVSRNSPDNAGVLLPNWENPNSLLSWNSPDNAGVLLHNWCVGRTLLLIMRRYSFGIVFLTIPPNAGIPLIMRGTPSGLLVF